MFLDLLDDINKQVLDPEFGNRRPDVSAGDQRIVRICFFTTVGVIRSDVEIDFPTSMGKRWVPVEAQNEHLVLMTPEHYLQSGDGIE